MHIPDGYLSPATCVALYGGAAPFWYVALRRLKSRLAGRVIPLISVFSAFSFVLMMFNLPLPGGTTGHCVGMAVSAIVLGPWGSMLAISAALLIQALFFGDGGLTALGANCFNMAVVGSLVAYLVYRVGSRGAPLGSARRVFAAGAAGYAAINAAALLAAIEFGIQPLFFHDASGAPLYAPYPLRIAVPAMMAGHLTIAGLAELVVSAGVVAWLQRGHLALLRATAPGAAEGDEEVVGWRAARPLLAGLAALLLLTPLGILAAGTAWGEWSTADFSESGSRREIAAASRNVAPPPATPEGMRRLSTIWTAPFPDYAPPLLRNASVGYALSGAFGCGGLLLAALVGDWVLKRRRRAN